LRNFDALETGTVITEPVRTVQERVTVVPISSAASHLLASEENWTWSELRDYIIREIESRHGSQPRDPRKEKGIFNSFLTRWPEGNAIRIAKAAFDIYDGWWANAPISVNRFCKASDPFFSQEILAKLER
jgi:hypothetical protein